LFRQTAEEQQPNFTPFPRIFVLNKITLDLNDYYFYFSALKFLPLRELPKNRTCSSESIKYMIIGNSYQLLKDG